MTIKRESNETPIMVALADMAAVMKTLGGDVDLLMRTAFPEGQAASSRDFWRRQLVRSAYAAMEGTIYAMKQVALHRVREAELILEPGELVLLSERETQVERDGKLKERSARIDTIANIRYGLEVYARVHDVPCPVDWGSHEWGELRAGIKVRDRLMHPKRPEQLVVSDDEALLVMRASLWFMEAVKKTMAAAIVTVAKETPGGDAIVADLFPDGLPS